MSEQITFKISKDSDGEYMAECRVCRKNLDTSYFPGYGMTKFEAIRDCLDLLERVIDDDETN